jgi:hypothetical protein
MTTTAVPAIEYREVRAEQLPDEQLIPDIADLIKRYVVLPSDDHALVLALWVLHTWTFEQSRTTPYIYVHSADKQSGKTRLIEVLEILVRNPMRATSVTPSVMFRAIDTLRPTVLLDEVDTIWAGSRNEIMRNILNGGYRVGGHVWRIQSQQPRQYNTFCPKLLAGIYNGFMPDTIQDRCIPVRMKRKEKKQTCEPFYAMNVAGSLEVEDLLMRIEKFVKDFSRELAYQRPEPSTAISDRQWEITEPLVALGCVFGAEARVRRACLAMFQDVKESPSLKTVLLGDIKRAFGGRERMFTDDIVRSLGGAWNGKLLSIWLAPYGIAPRQIRVGNQTGKGYKADQFDGVWEAT